MQNRGNFTVFIPKFHVRLLLFVFYLDEFWMLFEYANIIQQEIKYAIFEELLILSKDTSLIINFKAAININKLHFVLIY